MGERGMNGPGMGERFSERGGERGMNGRDRMREGEGGGERP